MTTRRKTPDVKGHSAGTRGRFRCAGGGNALFVGWESGDALSDILFGKPPEKLHLALVAWPDGRLTAHEGNGFDISDLDPFAPPSADLGGAMRALGSPFGTGMSEVARGALAHSPPSQELPDRATTTTFTALLDIDALRALGPYPISSPLYAAAAGPKGRDLVERLGEIPLLAGLVSPANASVLGKVPFGGLAGLLTRECGFEVTTALLRRLRGVPVPPRTTRDGTRSLLSMLSTLPVDHVPRDPDGIAVAGQLASAMSFLEPGSLVSRTAAPVPRLALRVLKGLGIDATESAKSGRIRQVLEDLPLFARDVALALRDDVLAPAAAHRGTEADADALLSSAYDILYGGASLVEAAETIHAWHRRRSGIERGLPAPRDAGTRWPSPCQAWRDAEGFEVVPLTGWQELVDEGDPGSGLDHCVGSRHYALASAQAKAAILSFRRTRPDGGFDRLGTVEIHPSTHSQLAIVQKKGHANGPFPEEAADAFARWNDARRSGELAFEWPRTGTDDAYGITYDHDVPGAVDAALAVWREVLPDRLRGETVASLVDRIAPAVDDGTVAPGPIPGSGPR